MRTERTASSSAAGLPVATTAASAPPASRIRSAAEPASSGSAPAERAASSLYALVSEQNTFEARRPPSMTCIMPVGPAPKTASESPSRNGIFFHARRQQASGSIMAASSKETESGSFSTPSLAFAAGTVYSSERPHGHRLVLE